jgi:hypothetical protein
MDGEPGRMDEAERVVLKVAVQFVLFPVLSLADGRQRRIVERAEAIEIPRADDDVREQGLMPSASGCAGIALAAIGRSPPCIAESARGEHCGVGPAPIPCKP